MHLPIDVADVRGRFDNGTAVGESLLLRHHTLCRSEPPGLVVLADDLFGDLAVRVLPQDALFRLFQGNFPAIDGTAELSTLAVRSGDRRSFRAPAIQVGHIRARGGLRESERAD